MNRIVRGQLLGLTIGLLAGMGWSAPASAAPITPTYPYENFEGYDNDLSFASQNTNWGSNLSTSDIGSTIAASSVAGTSTANGQQVLKLVSTNTNFTGVYTKSGNFTHINSGLALVGVDMMIPTSSDRADLNLYSGSTHLVSMTSSSFTADGAGKAKDNSNQTAVPEANTWYRLRISLDFHKQTIRLNVTRLSNGSFVGSSSGTLGFTTLNSLYLYSRQSHTAYYDNVFFRPVPEPASMVLLSMGGLLMLRRKRKA